METQNLSPRLTAFNMTELSQIANELQSLVGAQLQECIQAGSEAGLGFYHDRQMIWLWFDLHPQRPIVLKFDDKPPVRKKTPRPFTLFVKSRFEGRRLEFIRVDLERGRVLIFGFHRSSTESAAAQKQPIEIEATLIPHAANLTAIDGSARVAENKPKELPAQKLTEREDEIVRRWADIKNKWIDLQRPNQAGSGTVNGNGTGNATGTDADTRTKKHKTAVRKKREALERMQDELTQKMSNVYREAGEWLKANGTLEQIPAEYASVIDTEKSLSANIENVFHRAKENQRKAEGTRQRIAFVEQELAVLEKQNPATFGFKEVKQKESLLAKADARGRRHQVAADLEVFIGKSAVDNLSILRKAQPFDLWLHLRDFPGAHAIMRRSRGRNVTDQELQEAGRWVIEQSLGATRASSMKGERFDLLIVECRYVKPIKGDKLGRVNYTNDRVMSLRY